MARYGQSGGLVSMRVAAIAVALLVLLSLEHGDAAATFVVGDSNGWNIDAKGWPNGKVFRAGDLLQFNYEPGVHNVVAVNEEGYSSCTAPRGSNVLNSGKDEIKLSTGHNFFICTFQGHCKDGMKIAITAH